MSLEQLKTEVGNRFSTAQITNAWNKAVSLKGEGEAAHRTAKLLLKQMLMSPSNICYIENVTPGMYRWRSTIEAARVAVEEDPLGAVEENLAIVFNISESGITVETPTIDGSKRDSIEKLPDEVVLVDDKIGFIALDSRESFGPQPNPGFLLPVSIKRPRFGLGVIKQNGVLNPLYIRINDHFDIPTSDLDIPLKSVVDISNVVVEAVGNMSRMNSTNNMSIIRNETEVFDEVVTKSLLDSVPIPELELNQLSIVKGEIFNTIIREPSAQKSHVVWITGDSFEDDDSIMVFVSNEWNVAFEVGDEIQLVGRKFKMGDIEAFGADFFFVTE